eukprot:Rhum_TRINITY_DN14424_c7_g2::Rhum_TRINITY_DN14424_c7_g2_i1::g.89130::m.89130
MASSVRCMCNICSECCSAASACACSLRATSSSLADRARSRADSSPPSLPPPPPPPRRNGCCGAGVAVGCGGGSGHSRTALRASAVSHARSSEPRSSERRACTKSPPCRAGQAALNRPRSSVHSACDRTLSKTANTAAASAPASACSAVHNTSAAVGGVGGSGCVWVDADDAGDAAAAASSLVASSAAGAASFFSVVGSASASGLAVSAEASGGGLLAASFFLLRVCRLRLRLRRLVRILSFGALGVLFLQVCLVTGEGFKVWFGDSRRGPFPLNNVSEGLLQEGEVGFGEAFCQIAQGKAGVIQVGVEEHKRVLRKLAVVWAQTLGELCGSLQHGGEEGFVCLHPRAQECKLLLDVWSLLFVLLYERSVQQSRFVGVRVRDVDASRHLVLTPHKVVEACKTLRSGRLPLGNLRPQGLRVLQPPLPQPLQLPLHKRKALAESVSAAGVPQSIVRLQELLAVHACAHLLQDDGRQRVPPEQVAHFLLPQALHL